MTEEVYESSVKMEATRSSLTHYDTIVSVTTDRGAHPKRWIAVLVQMCTEKKVSEKLSRLNIESYLPTQTEIHQWSDRKKRIDRIVIPMILFVHIDEMEEKRLRMQNFIRKVLSYPGEYAAAVIPDEQIERLKFMLKHADAMVEMKDSLLEVGQNVKIMRGPLKGLEGELCYVNSDKPMVAIRIDCLGYACVNIAKSDIR